MRYIEMNPVRAGMVSHPAHYRWSSYHINALSRQDGLAVPHGEYLRLGEDENVRQAAYRQLFRSRLDDDMIEQIRDATNNAWVLGNDRFKQRVARQLSGDRRSFDEVVDLWSLTPLIE